MCVPYKKGELLTMYGGMSLGPRHAHDNGDGREWKDKGSGYTRWEQQKVAGVGQHTMRIDDAIVDGTRCNTGAQYINMIKGEGMRAARYNAKLGAVGGRLRATHDIQVGEEILYSYHVGASYWRHAGIKNIETVQHKTLCDEEVRSREHK